MNPIKIICTNQYWFICPRYWSLKENTSLTKEEVESGKYGNIIPFKGPDGKPIKKVPKDTSIFEFNAPQEHVGKNGEYIEHYPGFIKSGSHPDGYCLPCCFKQWDSKEQQLRREQCLEQESGLQVSKDVKKVIPSLAALAEGIGDPQVRNRGTIGGSIANNDPSADYPSACIALDAIIHTNDRKIEASKFFKGMFETALKKGELIEAIEFKIPEKSSYQKHPNPASRYAVVGVYVAKHKNGTRVAVTGAKPCVYNDKDLSKALDTSFAVNSISGMELNSSDMNSDIHASAEYRANLVVIQAKKAVEAC